jgi:O-antigen ligase
MSLESGFGPDVARLQYLRVGSRMIQDHPIFGVGPERVDDEFPRYSLDDPLPDYYGHLHNNVLQIAAERGLICLAAFFWFVFELYRSLFQVWKTSHESHRWVALSAIAALSGFLVAGLFEYNFGDSEVLLLLLFIVSAPLGIRDLYSVADVQEGPGR